MSVAPATTEALRVNDPAESWFDFSDFKAGVQRGEWFGLQGKILPCYPDCLSTIQPRLFCIFKKNIVCFNHLYYPR